MEIVNFKKKDMIPLTDDENRYYEKRKYCHICKRKFWTDKEVKVKYTRKLGIIVIAQENLEVQHRVFLI